MHPCISDQIDPHPLNTSMQLVIRGIVKVRVMMGQEHGLLTCPVTQLEAYSMIAAWSQHVNARQLDAHRRQQNDVKI